MLNVIYRRDDDRSFLKLFRISMLVVTSTGVVGLLIVTSLLSLSLNLGSLSVILPQLLEIIKLGLFISLSALLIGIVQIVLTSWFGEELIMFFIWLIPSGLVGTSVYLYLQTYETGVLIMGGIGLLFLLILFVKRGEIRMSARLIEVSAEVARDNPAMLVPQLWALLQKVLVTILGIPGLILVFGALSVLGPVLAGVASAVYLFLLAFAMAGLQGVADANNTAYANMWYSGRPSLSKARKQVMQIRAGVIKYAFLSAFLKRLRRGNSRSTSGKVSSTVSGVVSYFGQYTLVLMVVKKLKSLREAYSESAKTVFRTFVSSIGGSLGFGVIDTFRSLLSMGVLIFGGWYYASSLYTDLLVVSVVTAIIVVLGLIPLNNMFRPVVNTYHLLLYRAYTGNLSSKFNKETKELIRAVKKK